MRNNIKGKKKPSNKKVDVENLVVENGYVINKNFSSLLDTEEAKNLESKFNY